VVGSVLAATYHFVDFTRYIHDEKFEEIKKVDYLPDAGVTRPSFEVVLAQRETFKTGKKGKTKVVHERLYDDHWDASTLEKRMDFPAVLSSFATRQRPSRR